MRILIALPSLVMGGVESFCVTLAEELAKNPDDEIHLLLSNGQISPKYLSITNNSHVFLHILHKKRGFSFSFLRELKLEIDKIKPDIINSHSSHLFRYLVMIPSMRKRTIVHTLTNNPYVYNKKLFWLYKNRFNSKRWNIHVVAISERIKDSFVDVYHCDPKKIKVIYNGIKMPDPLLYPTEKRYDLFNCASLTDIKRQSLLVESLLYTKNQNLTLLIAGDGPNKEKIKAQIKEFGLEKRVLLVGEIADPTPLYFESKAFILPSSTEGSPISIVEAMAAGLPILASNIGGIPDLLETSPFKFIFDVSINAKELAAVIDNCFNKKQSFFDQARLENRRISDQWSIQNVAAQYKSFYSLCASKN